MAHSAITHVTGFNLRGFQVKGGAAGNLTVTGIAAGDPILYVGGWKGTADGGTAGNFTSEFTATAANTINNASGTATTSYMLTVLYLDLDA